MSDDGRPASVRARPRSTRPAPFPGSSHIPLFSNPCSGLRRELAVVHARENIRFNSICPGPLRTPLLMDFLNTEEKKQRRLVHVPMGRFGTARM